MATMFEGKPTISTIDLLATLAKGTNGVKS